MKKDALIAAGILAALYALSSMAGADNTFKDQSDFIRTNLQGSFGLSLSLLCLAVGLAIGIVRQSVMAIVSAVGVAIVASIAPGIMYGIFSAVM